MNRKKLLDLVEVIKANPGCMAVVDNDCWQLYSCDIDELPDDGDDDDAEGPGHKFLIADSESVTPRGDGYGSGNCYGGDLLQALAEIVGVKVKSV